jgi:hypothetical protein
MAGSLYTVIVPRELRALLSEDNAVRVAVAAINRAAEDIRAQLQLLTPKDTGETAARWRVAKVATATDLTVEITNDSAVMVWLEFGSGVFASEALPGLGVEIDGADPGNLRPRFVVRGNLPRFEDLVVVRMIEEIKRVYG